MNMCYNTGTKLTLRQGKTESPKTPHKIQTTKMEQKKKEKTTEGEEKKKKTRPSRNSSCCSSSA